MAGDRQDQGSISDELGTEWPAQHVPNDRVSFNPSANYDLRDPVPGAFTVRPPVCLHRYHSYLAAL